LQVQSLITLPIRVVIVHIISIITTIILKHTQKKHNIKLDDYKEKIENRFKGMTPEKKLMLSLRLYYSARELKEAALRSFHSDWSEEQIQQEVKRVFTYART